MILTCPSCGSTASACAWENDITAREAMQLIIALPAPVAKAMLGYLSLFRPTERALTWKKAKKVVGELQILVTPGYVSAQGKPDRSCPPHVWAASMEQMVERSATLQRPLKNHNYLRQVAWQLADQADSRQEQKIRIAEQTGATKITRPADDDMSPEMRRYIAENGDPLASPAMQELMQKMKNRQGEINAEQK